MRAIASAMLLCLFTFVAPAHAWTDPGRSPDCQWRNGQCIAPAAALPQARHFGTYTKAPKSQRVKIQRASVSLPAVASFGTPAHVAEARRYTGMNAAQIGLSRRTLWCGTFLGRVAERTGLKKPRNPNWAADWDEVGPRIAGPQPGAIALINARRGGRLIDHVGIVTGVTDRGDPIIISGNHNNRVVETAYPRGSVVAYVWPGA